MRTLAERIFSPVTATRRNSYASFPGNATRSSDERRPEHLERRYLVYFNVFGEKVSKGRFKQMVNAFKNRQELIAAGLTSRRDLLKMGLLTASGMLLAKHGLSARAQTATTSTKSIGGSFNLCLPGNQAASPPTRSFVEPLPIMPLAQTVKVSSLSPAPTIAPNTAARAGPPPSHHTP